MSDKEEWTETDENLSKLLESFTYEGAWIVRYFTSSYPIVTRVR